MSKRLLLVLPVNFYGFGQILSRSLESQGFEVVITNDEFPDNILGKILGKIGALSILRLLTYREFYRRYSKYEDLFDIVFIIKGRGVSVKLINFFKRISKRIVAYNFDSFRFNSSPLNWMHAVDRFCTFDIKDAKDYKIQLVHLFNALPHGSENLGKSVDVSVLMKNHSQRLAYTDKVISVLPDGWSKFIYIFEPNRISAFLGALRNPVLYVKYWKHIHFRPLPYENFIDILGKSKITVDYAHPSQTGITIRCFEACSLGVSIITNNSYIFDHPFFQSESVAHIPLNAKKIDLKDGLTMLLRHPMPANARSVEQFLNEVLELT